MPSRRNIVTAAAVMTLHATALSALAPDSAHGRTVYRCGSAHGGVVSYQAHPCTGHPPAASQLRVGDTRTEDQVRQALETRRREGFDELAATGAGPTRRARKKSTKAKPELIQVAQADKAPRSRPARKTRAARQEDGARHAGALSTHRIGERPFEHIGTPLSDAAPVKQGKGARRQANRHFTARAPASPQEIRPASTSTR